MKLNPSVVSKVKKSVVGKKYSELTEEEWAVLFADDYNLIDTVCSHNGIINDAATKPKNWKGGPYTGSKAPPKFHKEPEKKGVTPK